MEPKHPDHFEIGDEVIAPLNLRGTIIDRSTSQGFKVNLYDAGVIDWFDAHQITRVKD